MPSVTSGSERLEEITAGALDTPSAVTALETRQLRDLAHSPPSPLPDPRCLGADCPEWHASEGGSPLSAARRELRAFESSLRPSLTKASESAASGDSGLLQGGTDQLIVPVSLIWRRGRSAREDRHRELVPTRVRWSGAPQPRWGDGAMSARAHELTGSESLSPWVRADFGAAVGAASLEPELSSR
jgi:hypothetical protein